MDDHWTSVYLRELARQDDIVREAMLALGSDQLASAEDVHRLIQSVVGAAALASKLLWPPLERDWDDDRRRLATDRGRHLRRIVKPSTALERRAVRNALEHYDARLDETRRDRPRVNLGDLNAAPHSTIDLGPDGIFLRHFDPTTGALSVLGVGVDVGELANAMRAVRERADAWQAERSATWR